MPVQPSRDARLLQAFANTLDLRTFTRNGRPHRRGSEDPLSTPRTGTLWLVDCGLLSHDAPLDDVDLGRLFDLRAALRSSLDRHFDSVLASPSVFRLPVELAITAPAGPHIVPTGVGVDQALGQICVAALRTVLADEWQRLRMCAAPDCRWVFFDRSNPGRARWCAPDLCGNRMKTRDYRRRKRRPA
jgi:hypothetical protein